jgi:peptidoglycan/xylan/chitin deacetylase (PgdA/CDA1 family)
MTMRNPLTTMRRLAARAHVAWAYASLIGTFRASPRRVLVLRYHALGRPEEVAAYASPGISVTPERFEEQVSFLTSRYDVIDLDAALARVRGEAAPGSRPGVVITFDDGYRDNHEHGLPILRRYGATGTFYVVAGSVWPAPPVWTVRLRTLLDRPARPRGAGPAPFALDLSDAEAAQRSVRALTRWLRGMPADDREQRLGELALWLARDQAPGERVMMDTAELESMAEAGLTIGAHTLTHPLLPEVPEAEVRRELVEGRAALEAIVGRRVLHLSYPNPGSGAQHDGAVRAIAREAGYTTATTSTGGLMSSGSDPFALPRVGVTPGSQERLLFRFLGERSRHD